MADINGVQGIGGMQPGRVEPLELRATGTKTPAPSGASFQSVLKDAVSEVQKLQNEADTTIRQLVSGEIKDVTETMVAVERADVAFQTLMAVRNKMVAAYEEVMRMQV